MPKKWKEKHCNSKRKIQAIHFSFRFCFLSRVSFTWLCLRPRSIDWRSSLWTKRRRQSQSECFRFIRKYLNRIHLFLLRLSLFFVCDFHVSKLIRKWIVADGHETFFVVPEHLKWFAGCFLFLFFSSAPSHSYIFDTSYQLGTISSICAFGFVEQHFYIFIHSHMKTVMWASNDEKIWNKRTKMWTTMSIRIRICLIPIEFSRKSKILSERQQRPKMVWISVGFVNAQNFVIAVE